MSDLGPLPKYLEDACESIDAAVFSSDVLENKDYRETLQAYVDRWSLYIDVYDAEGPDTAFVPL